MKITHVGIANAAKAIYSKVKSVVQRKSLKHLLATEKETEKRLAICNACANNLSGQCQKCECFISLKTKFADESCPERYW
jgi:hypothetical protein